MSALNRSENPRLPPGVWAAPLAGHGGKPDQRLGRGAWLKHRRARVGTDVVGHLKMAKGAGLLGMWLSLRNALPVEVRHLLDQIVILQQQRPVGPDAE